MTDVLILGGTGWLSGRVAKHWVDAGARVTCLARGSLWDPPEGTQFVRADRDERGAYSGVSGRAWDEVVDISSNAAHVAEAVAALAADARHWTYVSTVSVYADDSRPGADESEAVVAVAAAGEQPDYGQAKAAAEASVRSALADRAAIVRPGLIVGPGDPSDRFGYWVGRFALAGDADVLTPSPDGLGAQVIDVDDLADFIVRVGVDGWVGTANAVGDSRALADVIALAQETAAHTGALVAATDDWLQSHDVAYWAGPRSLPLWLPRDMPGFATRTNDVYRSIGGRLRSLDETVSRTLADERERGLDRPRRSGLTRDEELELLAALAEQ